jgi:glycerophosphoryl diester phosphodiesterase
MHFEQFRRKHGAPPLVYGHRGVRGEAPENTMRAFELARAQGADGIELDIRPCATRELVVFHDPTLARCSDKKDERAVCDVPYGELSRIDVGQGATIPLLSEVLQWARGHGILINVEMKRDVPDRAALVAATAAALRALPDFASTGIVSSFDGWMLGRLGRTLPGVARGFLFEPRQRLWRSGWPAPLLGAAAVHPERTLVTPVMCRLWRAARRLVNVWTVNDVEEARRLAALGVDGIITDSPGVMVRALR